MCSSPRRGCRSKPDSGLAIVPRASAGSSRTAASKSFICSFGGAVVELDEELRQAAHDVPRCVEVAELVSKEHLSAEPGVVVEAGVDIVFAAAEVLCAAVGVDTGAMGEAWPGEQRSAPRFERQGSAEDGVEE